MKNYRIKSFDELVGHHAFVLGYAPNFPHKDYLEPDDQWTLERAFDVLRDGSRFAKFVDEPNKGESAAQGYLDIAEACFRDGNEAAAIKAMHDFEDASGIRRSMQEAAKSMNNQHRPGS